MKRIITADFKFEWMGTAFDQAVLIPLSPDFARTQRRIVPPHSLRWTLATGCASPLIHVAPRYSKSVKKCIGNTRDCGENTQHSTQTTDVANDCLYFRHLSL
jgi:hypothetical protein